MACFSAIVPANGSVVNYTQLMFEYDQVSGADHYVITITAAEQNGKKTGAIKVSNTSLAVMVTGLEFGSGYSWHYEAFMKEKIIYRSDDFLFLIRSSYLVNPDLFRTKIETSKQSAGDGIIFLDYRGIAIDRKGNPVWYYPFTGFDLQSDPNFRNLRMTADGNITFITDSNCYEANLAGKLNWQTPNDGKISGDGKEYYHHDFIKLPDGSYLTAGFKYECGPNYYNPAVRCRVRYNTLIQYDAAGNILWHWYEKDHVSQQVIFGIYTAGDTDIAGTHLNAFAYDAQDDAIVLSFRHNSSLAKIDKKTGKLIYMIGPFTGEFVESPQPLFLHQHGMAIMPDHTLLIYNNNVSEMGMKNISYPTVMMLKQPTKKDPVNKVWEYECRSNRYPNGIMGKGGYATPLPNGNILVCMGGANFTFEVTPAKEIVWQADFEKYDPAGQVWNEFINYRCSYSSSLFPKYFTLQHGEEKRSSAELIINNEGTEDDLYSIELIGENGSKKLFQKNISIAKRSSKAIRLKKKTGKSLQLVVTSQTNRSSSRTLSF
jgi:hypothetical protein